MRQDAHDPIRQAASGKLVQERLAEDVADPTLRIGDRHLEAESRDRCVGGNQLGAQQDKADLGAVAVRDDHAPAAGDQGCDVPGHLPGVLVLLVDRSELAVEDERIASDRNHGSMFHDQAATVPGSAIPRDAPSATRALAKQASGARAIPAPI